MKGRTPLKIVENETSPITLYDHEDDHATGGVDEPELDRHDDE